MQAKIWKNVLNLRVVISRRVVELLGPGSFRATRPFVLKRRPWLMSAYGKSCHDSGHIDAIRFVLAPQQIRQVGRPYRRVCGVEDPGSRYSSA